MRAIQPHCNLKKTRQPLKWKTTGDGFSVSLFDSLLLEVNWLTRNACVIPMKEEADLVGLVAAAVVDKNGRSERRDWMTNHAALQALHRIASATIPRFRDFEIRVVYCRHRITVRTLQPVYQYFLYTSTGGFGHYILWWFVIEKIKVKAVSCFYEIAS